MSEGILRHSKWDALLVALSLAHAGFLFVAPSIPLIAVMLWWNANTISHNFIHLPFFRSNVWNRTYSLYLSLLLGFPQIIWRERHLAHHLDRPLRLRMSAGLVMETGSVLLLWSILLAQSSRFFLTIYLPGYLAGLVLCYIHGYFDHAYGTKSNYGFLYNAPFFNDGYHVEHHRNPAEHWTRLPRRAVHGAISSRWPAILRWVEVFNLQMLERLTLHSRGLQKFLLKTHERALRQLVPKLTRVETIKIVGGGMFPRSALLLRKLFPCAEITVIDASAAHLQMAKKFLDDRTHLVQEMFDPFDSGTADLVVIPLSFIGERRLMYKQPAARSLLIHDWIWSKRGESVVVSLWLLKRINLIQT